MNDSVVISSTDIALGKKAKGGVAQGGYFIAPLQFLPIAEKDEDWTINNADYWEWQGLRQIFRKAPRMLKNINLSKGVIDKGDYMPVTAPENQDILNKLMEPDQDMKYDSLRFYPLVPKFINAIVAEFAERRNELTFKGSDERTTDELLSLKTDEIIASLIAEEEPKLQAMLAERGISLNSPEGQQAYQQGQEQIKSMPDIQRYFEKSYRSIIAEWAAHQTEVDTGRFSMKEMEIRNFRYSVEVDSEVFHFRMLDDDYIVEEWNPVLTAVFKEPDQHYYGKGYACTHSTLMTIPSIIDAYGWLMNREQQESMETIYPNISTKYALTGYSRESYYDNTRSLTDNNQFSPGMKQTLAMAQQVEPVGIANQILNQNSYTSDIARYMARVTTIYWKSQRKVGKMTRIKENGDKVVEIVDETYRVTDTPEYDETFVNDQSADTLIFGEHIDWVWIPQVWGAIKIGPNIPSWNGMTNTPVASATGFKPIYLGINQNRIGPLRYQFQSDDGLYGAELPIEGATFSDYNGFIVPPVQLMEPDQIAYNVVRNQMMDMLMDETGPFVAMDARLLPGESLADDWGPDKWARAYTSARTYGFLPVDKSLENTQSSQSSASQLQVIDLSQTPRFQSRIMLAQMFEQSALSIMGFNQQRLGTPLGRQTATGVKENMEASYSQTEMLFIQHSDWLMPRVHEKRTDLAIYYNSNKPSVRLQYITRRGDQVNFQINGDQLKLRTINIEPKSDANTRAVMDSVMRRLEMDNTSNFEFYDLADVSAASSLSELDTVMQGIRKRMDAQRQEQFDHEQQMQEMKNQAMLEDKKMAYDQQMRLQESKNRANVIVAQIRAAGYSGSVDLDANQQNDFLDNLQEIQDQSEYQETMGFEREKETNRGRIANQQADLKREDMNNKLRMKEMDMNIARENTSRSELDAKKKQIEKDKKAKTKKK